MVRIAIFGATGRTGNILVQKALAEGNDVVAIARHPENLQVRHERLSIVTGELDDDEAIANAISGADAVIEGVGAVSDGTKRIVDTMDRQGVRRLIAISTCSVSDALDLPDAKFKALIQFVKTAAPQAYKEILRAAEFVRSSDLDWTLVRVAKLKNGSGSGRVKVGYYGHGVVGLSIARADLASFLLDQAKDDSYIKQSPAISN